MACFSPSNDRDEQIDAILTAAHKALEFVGDASDYIPVPGLSPAVDVLSSIIDTIEVFRCVLFHRRMKAKITLENARK